MDDHVVFATTTATKNKEDFRDYEAVTNPRQAVVLDHYQQMRQKQTVAFVRRMHDKYNFNQPRCKMTIAEAFRTLDGYVDCSDPDLSLPNIIHCYQTAEAIRRAGKPDWMQLVGLIHDLGKIMFLWGTPEDGQQGTADGRQWALGGDTFVVGCALPDCCVFSEFNVLNPDMTNELYSTDLGIYQRGCGLSNVLFAYGHDEYLWQMLKANNCTLPEEAMYMVRFHSAYPWHTGRNGKRAYEHLEDAHDKEMMPHVIDFNRFDLYTKDELGQLSREEADALWPYYEGLIAKYFPDPANLKW